MMPELAYTMLACARIGAVHSVVFGGFSAESLRDRILDARCRMVVTANEGLRGGKRIPLKKTVDRAIEGISLVETVLVARRTDTEVADAFGARLLARRTSARSSARPAPTSGWGPRTRSSSSTPRAAPGSPRASCTRPPATSSTPPSPTAWSSTTTPATSTSAPPTSGWVTGHSYIVYGPLANGATTVMFESTPTYPDPGRYWRIVDDLGVNILYTAPTALRALAQAGNDFVKSYKRDSLRILGTVGEPINPEIWRWYHDVVGEKRCAVVDTWWQTETGGILITPLPGRHAHEARLGHPALLRDQAGDRRSRRRQGARGQRRERRPVPRARRGRVRRGPCGATTTASARPTSASIPATTSPATGPGATRTATTGSPAASTTC